MVEAWIKSHAAEIQIFRFQNFLGQKVFKNGVQGNTSNIIFLKSTDDSMLDTLQKMSGTTHETYRNGKTITRDMERLFMPNEGKITINMQTVERPVIMYNDLAFMPPRNSIVFRAGDPPIWNRNETILLMSWRMFQNTITQPGKEYTLQTIPTLSSAAEFDVRTNQPDFIKMWEKRRDEALRAQEAKDIYQQAYGYTDYQVSRLDPDVWSDDIMEMIMAMTGRTADNAPELDDSVQSDAPELSEDELDDIYSSMFTNSEYEENTELQREVAQRQEANADRERPRYAGGVISRAMLGSVTKANHSYDEEIIAAFKETRAYFFRDPEHFVERRGSLVDVSTGRVLIEKVDDSESLKSAKRAAKDPDMRVFAEDDDVIGAQAELGAFEVMDEFYFFLMRQDSWDGFASGMFEREMAKLVNSR